MATFQEGGRFTYHYFTDLDFQWAMQGGFKMLSIRVNLIESTQIVSPVVDSSCRKSICMYRYFKDLDFRWAVQGGLKMLSIRVDSIESTRIVSPVVDSSCWKSICMYRYFTDLDFRWAIQGGRKCCRFDRIDTNRFPCCRFIMSEVDLRDTTPCESS